MAALRQYTPRRRLMMQVTMWLILGATAAIAAMITSHRHSQFEVKLTKTTTIRRLSVQLPGNWRIVQSPNPLSPLLVTAIEPDNENEEGGPREIRIIREPMPGRQAPFEYAAMQMPLNERELQRDGDIENISVASSPGILLSAAVQHQGRLEDVSLGKVIVAAAVPPSGRGIAVVLDGDGLPDSSDANLVKRIAQSIKVSDEPNITNQKQITLGEAIGVNVLDGYSVIDEPDPLRTSRELRANDTGQWRSIDLVPILFLPKDGNETIATMLSLFDPGYAAAEVHRDSSGIWQVQSPNSQIPGRAYAVAKDGQGIIAIFSGGKDDQWVDGAWQQIAGGINWPEKNSVDRLVAAGAEQAKRITDAGLAKLRSDDRPEQWFLDCIGGPEKPFGWVHVEPATNGGRIESRCQIPDRWIQKSTYDWHSSVDLKTSYRASHEFTYISLLGGGPSDASSKQIRTSSAILSKGKIDLGSRGGDVGDRDLNYLAPANYVPGGWLPDIISTVSDTPMILRIDSFFDLSYFQNTDMLTVTLRPLPSITRPTSDDENAALLRAVSVEVSGSGERSTWYFRPDGTLNSIDDAADEHLIHREQNDITMDFAREQQMQP